MGENIFTRFDEVAAGEGGQALWAARAPYRPELDFDLMLIPRLPQGTEWRQDDAALAALERIEAEPWVDSIAREGKQPTVKLSDERIEAPGEGSRSGAGDGLAGRAAGSR